MAPRIMIIEAPPTAIHMMFGGASPAMKVAVIEWLFMMLEKV